jgi:hypothetical protein
MEYFDDYQIGDPNTTKISEDKIIIRVALS